MGKYLNKCLFAFGAVVIVSLMLSAATGIPVCYRSVLYDVDLEGALFNEVLGVHGDKSANFGLTF